MKHIHETWAFLVKAGIWGTSVYNVYGSQNEFVERVTSVFILRMRNLGQNRPLSTEHRICGRVNWMLYYCSEFNYLIVCTSSWPVISSYMCAHFYLRSPMMYCKCVTLPVLIAYQSNSLLHWNDQLSILFFFFFSKQHEFISKYM